MITSTSKKTRAGSGPTRESTYECEVCHAPIPADRVVTGGHLKGKVLCSRCSDEKIWRASLDLRRRKRPGELRHGLWLQHARESLGRRRITTPLFALLVVFIVLYAGTVSLFESVPGLDSGLFYGAKLAISSLFTISLGFLLSVWWSATTRFDSKLAEAERVDREYRELLLNFSDNLFHIINALNTLAKNPPRSFVIATEFLLAEYVDLLQQRLQRYGDYIAGLGFEASEFLDEKIRIFEGIRDRASLSIKGMPNEIQALFVDTLNLDPSRVPESAAERQEWLRTDLKDAMEEEGEGEKSSTPGESADRKVEVGTESFAGAASQASREPAST